MSDVVGPSNFYGILVVLVCGVVALAFTLIFLVNLCTWQFTAIASSTFVIAVNLIAAFIAFKNMGGAPAKVADYASQVWGALSIAGFLYIRRRLIRLTASSQEEGQATTNTSNADRIN
ncbi:hypothetical protein ACQR5V_01655 [Xanthomonas oryzae pv. oryzicola]|uniref:hypothetical protein n=1 Tax=Xanthomonas oryzae TaxID=347 RepID=UPI000A497DCE|nr:hypothetical protein [Xanthomonas oryzae]